MKAMQWTVFVVLQAILAVGDAAALAPSAARPVGRGRGRGGGRGGRGVTGVRGRGAATAARRGANRQWFERRASGDPAARRRSGPRAKRWEREGDSLYEEHTSDPSIFFRGLSAAERLEKAEEMLAALAAPPSNSSKALIAQDDASSTPAAQVALSAPKASPAMWGACSVGPVLKSRLLGGGMTAPFAIQEAAFTPISKGKNVVIGSATGSGKTLAFLLPILATSQRSTPSRVLVVTASQELT